jgi:hypothetical protein
MHTTAVRALFSFFLSLFSLLSTPVFPCLALCLICFAALLKSDLTPFASAARWFFSSHRMLLPSA